MTTKLFTGGHVFDGLGSVLKNHAVLVEGDTIKDVAPAEKYADYQGDTVDTSGGTLMPGIADCHVHLVYKGEANPRGAIQGANPGEITLRVLENAQTALKSGITAVRDCGGRDYLEFPVRDACNSGRFMGPNIMASGKMICMTGGHGNENGRVADGCDDVVRAVREQVHAGSDLIKIMATGGVMTKGVDPEDAHYSAEEMAAGVGEARRFRRTSASHAQGAEGIMNAVLAGITSIEHGIFMDQECLDAMLERGTYLVPTLAAVKNIINNKDKGIADYVVEKALRVYDRHQESFTMFYKAGGKIAMGTDAGTPFNLHGENALELAYMVECGMSAIDSLTSATSVAHDLMTLSDRGRIVADCKADLLIVNGNPEEDIMMAARSENHRAVYKNGKKVDLD
ncbi:metal-dependent hydrolase family protein [Sneathiella chinensis]|uniref:Amidohydrolase n=1 Tax=Sneathiella chinensis TaxID=349750 RepID=A0ABQ5TZ73_9PROT|nr:amidohydrolase family protein [Sneathiella chinensis]GLQ05179.1 amidohydrolase [Sneathiella chinensis]